MNGFDEILKSKLENYQEMPPEHVLSNIRSQYPKPRHGGINGRIKILLITAVATVAIISGLVIYNNTKSTSENKIVEEQVLITYESEKSINTINNYPNDNLTKNIVPLQSEKSNTDENLSHNDESIDLEKNKVNYIEIFTFNDTTVCGLSFITEFSGSISSLQLPDHVKAFKIGDKLQLVSSKEGVCKVAYNNKTGYGILTDSFTINFYSGEQAEIALSDKILCPGEELIVFVKNTAANPIWADNIIVKNVVGSAYHITGLLNGENQISLSIVDGYCVQKFSQIVNVVENIEYQIISTPNVCSGSNGTLTIKAENSKADLFTLNNNIESKNGYFKGLDPGIYSLEVKYAGGCIIRDTLLIRDSLNISPYFISEKNLLNPNKYTFRNLTNVDDKGYERNDNVEFIWKVDGNVISNEDNPEHEFISKGEHIVELVAILNETCQNIYSETISVSISNFRIPNIFTPNGDGIGDEFVVVYEGELASYQLEVINRSGEIVYQSEDIRRSWTGKINGNDDAAEGLYYYIIRGEDKLGNKIEQKGSLQLVRN